MPDSFSKRYWIDAETPIDPPAVIRKLFCSKLSEQSAFILFDNRHWKIVDPRRDHLERFFPDLALPEFRLLIEVDSMVAHGSQLALGRDLRRQNKLMRGFHVLRFTAVEILDNPHLLANEVYRFVRTLTPSNTTWSAGGVQVSYSLNKFQVVDPSRGRLAG